jgi:prolipoprotein diacylglyceryl transferase
VIFAAIPSPTQSQIEIGPLTFHFYALSIITGIIAAVFIGNKRYVALGGRAGVVSDVAIYAVPFGIIGGRLYHVISSPQAYFGTNGDPLSALYIWQGGLGIWGAISIGLLGAYIGYRRNKSRGDVSFASFADALAPGLLIAQGIGRWGNWFNKELFGRELNAPWALEIPLAYRPIGYSSVETFHPVFLYESIWCFIAALILIKVGSSRKFAPGSIFALYVALYCLGRALIETIRIDEANLIFGVRLNVWTSVVLLFASLIYLRQNQLPKESSVK